MGFRINYLGWNYKRINNYDKEYNKFAKFK